ncbi:hypothetical protein DTO217A2_4182 [Paecilomyces variotii]|nr:hypothetical protein DTO217A2_4182 [Paecilomyces variotii]
MAVNFILQWLPLPAVVKALGLAPVNILTCSPDSDFNEKAALMAKVGGEGSLFQPKIHPLVDKVSREVNDYFLQHWAFEDEPARKKFIAAGFSKVTCLYYPLALNDRIHFACRLLTLLFLVDDLLEDMSMDEGSAYNERLIVLSRGNVLPDRSIPVEWITYDLWESMRAHDKALADEILEPVFSFMRAQTDKVRLSIKGLGNYLEYRDGDVGKALLSALMRFSMNLQMADTELAAVTLVENNCSKHISVINDIYSWEKEYRQAQSGHHEGSALCSSVQVTAEEINLSHDAAKRVLFSMCREWERVHAELVAAAVAAGCSRDLKAYLKGVEYQMSGNEEWSRTTPRYHSVK